MRGISAILSMILIVMIVVSLTSLFWTFMSSIFTTTTDVGSYSTKQFSESLSSCMEIESMNKNEIYVRNCGKGIVSDRSLAIYIDDEKYQFTMTPQTIGEGQVGTVKLFFYTSESNSHTLKINGPSFEATKAFEIYQPSSSVVVMSFSESTGPTTADSSGNNNYGNLVNSPSRVSGKYGNALSYNGVNQYVGVWDSESLRIGGSLQTEAWIRTNDRDGTRMSIANRFDGALDVEKGWLLYIDDEGKLVFQASNDGITIAKATGFSDLRDDKWHHVIGSYNGTYAKVIVDGKIEGSVPYNGGIWNGAAGGGQYGLNIGRRCPICGGDIGAMFNGTIDSFKLYNNTRYIFETAYMRALI